MRSGECCWIWQSHWGLGVVQTAFAGRGRGRCICSFEWRLMMFVSVSALAHFQSLTVGPCHEPVLKIRQVVEVLWPPRWRREHTCPLSEFRASFYKLLCAWSPLGILLKSRLWSLGLGGPEVLNFSQAPQYVAGPLWYRRLRLSNHGKPHPDLWVLVQASLCEPALGLYGWTQGMSQVPQASDKSGSSVTLFENCAMRSKELVWWGKRTDEMW